MKKQTPAIFGRFEAHRQSLHPHHLRNHDRSQSFFPPPAIPGLKRSYDPVLPHGPPPGAASRSRPPTERVSPITRITLPTCRVHYPGQSDRCMRRLLSCPRGLPQIGGSIHIASFDALRLTGSLNRPKTAFRHEAPIRQLPSEPLVSYQTNWQLSWWNLPPPLIRAFGAHPKIQRSSRWM